ncbi:MAG: PAS domain S-box protein [Magnetovibrio sp.]|nr:PAS domain S-box protein [Magnetovibrio sp.]
MTIQKIQGFNFKSLGTLLLLAWTVVVGSSLVWNVHQNDEQTEALALREALTIFNKDQGFRLWGTRHGGVYVPATEETPPSPYMAHIPERDIITPSGVKLTLLNPAYMLRQMMEDFASLYGVRGRITGLIQLRPQNAPDDWETHALKLLKADSKLKEVSEISDIDGAPYIRFMRPMYMKPGCEKCHGHLGYKLGDFRGGVSVALPMTPYINQRDDQNFVLAESHGVIWLIGSLALWGGGRRISASFAQTRKAEAEVRALNWELERRVEERTYELTEKSKRLSTTISNAADGIIVIDTDGKIDTFNEAASRIFGYAEEECIGKPITMLMPEPHATMHQSYINNHMNTGHTHVIGHGREVEARRKDGTTFPVYLAVSKLQIGNKVLFSGICRDLTQTKQVEKDLREAKGLAEQANRAKSEFLASMSHELRTPLNGIIGFSQLLQFDPSEPLTGKQNQYASLITTAGQHLLSLINDILDLSRIETEGFSMSIETINPTHAIESCLTLIAPVGEKHDVEFAYEKLEAPLPLVYADEVRFKQVLMNLLSNGAKYNRKGGCVILRAETLGDKVRFYIIDDGYGIALEKQEQLFEPFNRLGQEAGTIEGSGIGLTVTRKLLHRMNGEIGFKSVPDLGSTFWFEVPISSDTESYQDDSVDETLSDLNPPSEPKKVLYIEDNNHNRQLVQELLAPYENIEYHTSLTGEDGIMKAEEISPDLVLMDIDLPGIDGFETLRRLKASETTQNIPVIAVSANALPRDIRKGSKAQFEKYLTKPLDVRRALKTIFHVLKHKSDA